MNKCGDCDEINLGSIKMKMNDTHSQRRRSNSQGVEGRGALKSGWLTKQIVHFKQVGWNGEA